ncbi:EexN family lipoprotein [Phyllobacterium zundukense]|uniref:EexN family lipoprotein n=1 Tax=Phyllobacterium zundukense TaxID=1867719 RepID=A0ACD4CVZ6_9HYPH|nr:EexN family lipoprotein [Phyllobacterium zundukense]UXN57773.1 EexN family lipoprotein [Phyllobacterium zundukense]
MKQAFLAMILLALAGCSGQSETSYTVDELVGDAAMLAKIITECRNNPGELRDTPNCSNAEAADGKLRLERMRRSLGS